MNMKAAIDRGRSQIVNGPHDNSLRLCAFA
jgi:hypothetical protein